MTILTEIKKIKLTDVFLLGLIFFFTFPPVSFYLLPGLDSSYYWFFNQFFSSGFSELTKTVYPLGPLGFLVHPLKIGDNHIWHLVIFSLVRFVFIAELYFFDKKSEYNKYLLSILIPLFVTSFGYNIVFLVFVLSAKQIVEKYSPVKFAISVILAVTAYLSKLSDGLEALSIILVFIPVFFYKNRNKSILLQQILITLSIFVFYNLFVFGNLEKVFDFLQNNILLASVYSATLSVYSQNYLFALIVAWAILLLFPFVLKNNVRLVYILAFPLIFASWKHGFSRADYTHYRAFVFALFSLLLIVNSIDGFNKKTAGLSLLAFSLFYLNLLKIDDRNNYYLNLPGINNFTQYLTELNDTNLNFENQLEIWKKYRYLPPDFTGKIDSGKVDIYPYDLSYIPANNLNYLPRKTIHSGGSSAWFDSLDALNLNRKAVRFALFHLEKDTFGNYCGSLDYRYFFNDHPKLVNALFSKYKPVSKYKNLILFDTLHTNLQYPLISEKSVNAGFDKWIKIDNSADEIVQAKLQIKHTFWDKIKSFFAKPDEIIIDYKFSNARILSYALNEDCAKHQISINPFFKDLRTNYLDSDVKYIRFRLNNDTIRENRKLKLIIVKRKNRKQLLANLNKTKLLRYLSDSVYCFNNLKDSILLINKQYAFSYSALIDSSLGNTALHLQLEAKVKLSNLNSGIKLVVSIENNNRSKYWKAYELGTQIFVENKWRKFKLNTYIPNKKGQLKIYFWNPKSDKAEIDDLKLIISTPVIPNSQDLTGF